MPVGFGRPEKLDDFTTFVERSNLCSTSQQILVTLFSEVLINEKCVVDRSRVTQYVGIQLRRPGWGEQVEENDIEEIALKEITSFYFPSYPIYCMLFEDPS